jgi:hypothetical protein
MRRMSISGSFLHFLHLAQQLPRRNTSALGRLLNMSKAKSMSMDNCWTRPRPITLVTGAAPSCTPKSAGP